MAGEAGAKAYWSSGLRRSYSEHADLVLRHFGPRPLESARCTRSGPDFRSRGLSATRLRELGRSCERSDHEDFLDQSEHGDHARAIDDRPTTWTSETSSRTVGAGCRARELGAGDPGPELSVNFSELSLQSSEDLESAQLLGPEPNESSDLRSPEDLAEPLNLLDDESFELVDIDEYDDVPERRWADSSESSGTFIWGQEGKSERQQQSERHERLNGQELKRKISYEDWEREKRQEVQRRRAELRRREREERAAREREEKQRYRSFLEWLERKREAALRERLLRKESQLQRSLRRVEAADGPERAARLREWCRHKDRQLKAVQKEECAKRSKAEEEKQRKLQERLQRSIEAYQKWREKAKNTPRPATQGLLPHQKAKPAFTNPAPWQPLVENTSDDSDSVRPTKSSNKLARNEKIAVKR